MKRLLCAIIFLAVVPQKGEAVRGVENYPKVLTYSSAINLLPESVQDTLSWYDLLVCVDRPLTIQNLRQRNPDQKYLWMAMPQHADPFEGDGAWWIPDTLWSFKRLVSVYAAKNDWYLKDTQGRIITDGNHLIVNWTEYCPPGTFGSSKGMRAAEWIASRALPEIALSGRYWEPWSWDSNSAYNGFMFEILVDCLGSYGWQTYASADPDQDGIAEGVYHTCSTGGANDPLSVLFRAENEVFFQRLSEAFPDDFVFTINENSNYLGPWWRTKLSGMKIENWMRGCCPDWADWWDYFYGITPPYDPGNNWGIGYLWAEWAFDKPVEDRLRGWDLSWIQVWRESRLTQAENLRQMRFGLGTSMLGDGFFCYTKDQRMPQWQPEFDWDFGLPLADFSREAYGADTLYTRIFDRGMVEVNPAPSPLQGVPGRDTRFTFWLPVGDLAAQATGEETIRLSWTTPDGDHNEADSYELRYGEEPLRLENWEDAIEYAENPIESTPGSPVSVEVSGLQPGTTYHFAIRTRTRGRPEPLLSNPASATTSIVVDTTPPGAARELGLVDAGSAYLQIRWIASGDDGDIGMATRTRIRYRVGAAIQTEAQWNSATPVNPPLPPPPAGGADTYRVSGLAPATLYGLAVRMEDEAGNLGPLHEAFTARTANSPPPPPPADTTPPAAIADLAAVTAGEGAVDLAWSAPGDDGLIGRAEAYEIRYLIGRAIATGADWSAAVSATPPLPDPGLPGSPDSHRVAGLKPGAFYGFAVRAKDEAENLGPLSNPATALAGELPPPPPELDEVAPDAIIDLTVTVVGETTAELEWTAPGDDGDQGTAEMYELGLLQGRGIDSEEDWLIAARPADSNMTRPAEPGTRQGMVLRALQPGSTYGVALRARDEAGNISPLHPPVSFTTAIVPPPPGDGDPPDLAAPEPIADLSVAHADTTEILLVWTAPADSGSSGATRYRVRVAPFATADDRVWSEGDSISSVAAPSHPGTADSLLVGGLEPGTGYAFCVRSEDPSGNLSDDSNVARAVTPTPPPPPPPPPLPPAAIADLRLIVAGPDSAVVAWTAPGDDGAMGTAQRYLARIRAGAAIETELDWQIASAPDTTQLPRPSASGSQERWTLQALLPGTTYSLAIRAQDDSSLLGGISNRFLFATENAPSPPPGPILDLVIARLDPSGCDLRWTSPHGGTTGETAARLRVVLREGNSPIATEEDWAASLKWTGEIPAPSPPGRIDSLRIEPLTPGLSYALAIRAENGQGRLGALGNSPVVLIPEEPDTTEHPPVDPDPPPAAITDLIAISAAPDSLELRWTAVGGDSLAGRAAGYIVRLLEGARIATPEDWSRAATGPPLGNPLPAGSAERALLGGLVAGASYGVAVRALDRAGQISPFVPGAWVELPRTEDPPDTVAAILPPEGLALVAVEERSASLSFRHRVGPGAAGSPLRFVVALSTVPLDEASWEGATLHPDPPEPAGANETLTLLWSDLDPGTVYWVAARAVGAEGQQSYLSNIVQFETPAIDLAPPRPPTGLRAVLLPGDGGIRIEWEPSPDADVAGYFIDTQDSRGDWTRWNAIPLPPETRVAELTIRAAAYAITAIDASGNESARATVAIAGGGRLGLRGPFPHPVTTSCRFEIEIPPGLGGETVVLTLRDIEGRIILRLAAVPNDASRTLVVEWDRRDASGRPAAPGFYLLTVEAKGERIQRRIFLDP